MTSLYDRFDDILARMLEAERLGSPPSDEKARALEVALAAIEKGRESGDPAKANACYAIAGEFLDFVEGEPEKLDAPRLFTLTSLRERRAWLQMTYNEPRRKR